MVGPLAPTGHPSSLTPGLTGDGTKLLVLWEAGKVLFCMNMWTAVDVADGWQRERVGVYGL